MRNRFRGALVGGAIGDAMGRPNESHPAEVDGERKRRAYQPWHGWTSGPKGTITDDTQMTMGLVESGGGPCGDRGRSRRPAGPRS
jgi:ADP-ribosylglycohydrolase